MIFTSSLLQVSKNRSKFYQDEENMRKTLSRFFLWVMGTDGKDGDLSFSIHENIRSKPLRTDGLRVDRALVKFFTCKSSLRSR